MNNLYGILDSKGGHIDTSKTLRGAKVYATRNGYNIVTQRFGYNVIVKSEKVNGKWVKK